MSGESGRCTFRFSPGQIGPGTTTFTIPATDFVYGNFGPVFTVSIDGSPWTFALDEPWDTYAEEAFYTQYAFFAWSWMRWWSAGIALE
jgi:hypothetical protein